TAICVTTADASRHSSSEISTRDYNPSAVAPFEIAHERNQRVDTGFRERVIDRRAHAADGAMSLETVEPGRSRFPDEHLLQLFICEPERDVHQRPAVLR